MVNAGEEHWMIATFGATFRPEKVEIVIQANRIMARSIIQVSF